MDKAFATESVDKFADKEFVDKLMDKEFAMKFVDKFVDKEYKVKVHAGAAALMVDPDISLWKDKRSGDSHKFQRDAQVKEVQVDEAGNVRLDQSKQKEFGTWRESALKCAWPDDEVQGEVQDQDEAEPITERGTLFRLEDANIYVEQHGEDFFEEGPRLEILKMRDKLEKSFMLKQAVVISQHADDDKESWHEEIDKKHIDEMVKPCGVEDGYALSTPGYKDINVKQICEHLRRANKFRMHVEKMNCIKMQPSSFLNACDYRHAAWISNQLQPRGNGWNYSGPVVDFSENVLFKVVADDKYDDRWLRELFVGNQVPVSLRSGKAEVTACAKGLIEGLYLGPGEYMRAEIWIQEVPRSSAAWVIKFNGKEKVVDLFTKYLTRNEIIMHIAVLGFELEDAEGVPLGCNGLAISLVSVAAEEDGDDSEVDMQLGGVLMTYAD